MEKPETDTKKLHGETGNMYSTEKSRGDTGNRLLPSAVSLNIMMTAVLRKMEYFDQF